MFFDIFRRLFQPRSAAERRRARSRSVRSRPVPYRPRLELLEDRVVPTTSVWVGGSLLSTGQSSGGDPSAWSNPLNWQGGVPTAGSTVVFTDKVFETYVNNGNVSHHAGPQNFTANVDAVFSVGSVSADSSWGGTVNVNNPLSMTSGLSLASGTFGGGGGMTLSGTSTWAQGNLVVGSGGLTNNGTLSLTNPLLVSDILEGSGTLFNSGTVVQSGAGGLGIASGATLDNQTGATYTIAADSGIGGALGNSGTFINAGTLQKTATATGTSTIANGLAFQTSGAITVSAGILQIGSTAGTYTGGAFTVSPGAVLDLGSGLENGVTYTGTYTGTGGGTIALDYAPLDSDFSQVIIGSAGATFNFAPGMFQWTGGEINLVGNLTNNNSMTLSNGFDGFAFTPRVTGTGTLFNAGTIVQADAVGLDLFSGATLNNQAGATYTFQADSTIGGDGTGTFLNAGTLKKTASTTGTSTINSGVAFDNSGAINVQAGDLQLQGDANSASTGGTFTVSANAVLDLTGGLSNATCSGTYTSSGAGTVSLNSGTLKIGAGGATFNFPTGMFQWSGGTIDTTKGNLTNSGTLTLSNVNAVGLDGNGTLVNSGTIVQSGAGGLDIVSSTTDATTLNNKSGATYTLQGDGGIFSGNGGGTFINAGTLKKTASTTGTSTISSGIAFDNSGAITVSAGDLQLQGDTNSASTGGTFTVSAGALLDLTGGFSNATYSGTYTGSGAGTISLNSGTLKIGATGATFNFPGNLFQWTGGTIDVSSGGTLTMPKGSALNVNTNQGNVALSGAGKLTNNGTINQSGGTGPFGNALFLENGTTLNNASGATYTFLDDGTLTPGNGGGTLVNAGTVQKTGGTGTTTIASPLNTTGTVNVVSGTVNVSGTVTQISSNTLTAGAWTVTSTPTVFSTLQISSANFATIGTKAKVTLNGPHSTFTNLSNLASILSGGSFTLAGGASFATSGPLTSGGAVTVGAGSVLTVTGSFTQQSTGTLVIQMAGTSSAPTFGQVASTTGTITLGGHLTVTSSVTPAVGSSFELLDNAGNAAISGIFVGLPEGSTFTVKVGSTTMTFKITYVGTDADGSNNVVITRIS